jgi:hypothetical protein
MWRTRFVDPSAEMTESTNCPPSFALRIHNEPHRGPSETPRQVGAGKQNETNQESHAGSGGEKPGQDNTNNRTGN